MNLSPIGAEGARPQLSTLDVVRTALAPVADAAILDVGCGGGALARALGDAGARVTGIDPQETALEAARRRAPAATFLRATAETLPFADAQFDRVVFLNSLHHVPEQDMAQALAEAARVARGTVLIVEPLAEGPSFQTMLPIEDETAIRAAAQAAIAQAVSAGLLSPVSSGDYDDPRIVADVDAFLARAVAVDPARGPRAVREKPQVGALLAQFGVPVAGGFRLSQPHRVHLLRSSRG
ncbi:class I SAM-dependent methyltransferase [Aquabacter spiritensis]|uniref:Pimeloyl-CoA biosynthesis protein BioC n=1 Tax=Aquabacter spiritensis TaxID=933073 RepID=A0A4R3LX65_9HYPH|nr:class I SAM-dependent methyltransferase [Aquabacter spiritensis]TCT04379.1 pimeloyl-CoA biosynthesis protein BioC [Aquabacter spiritensis]